MSTQHTPGPWVVEPARYGIPAIGIRTDKKRIAVAQIRNPMSNDPLTANGCDEAEAEANARLIAAAPDLLAALQRINETNPCRCPEGDKIGDCDFCQARAAIAKAEGGAA